MSDIGKTLRLFSVAGPCLTHAAGAGPIVRETVKFYVTRRPGGPEQRVSKARWDAHVEPCSSCKDHPGTAYPLGLMD